jgi:hypothetical protein
VVSTVRSLRSLLDHLGVISLVDRLLVGSPTDLLAGGS